MGNRLKEGIARIGAELGLALRVCGYGTAFGLHFTRRTELINYRDTLEDDKAKLEAYVRGMLEEGVYLLPDGRVYTSTVHTEREVEETLAAAGRVLARLQ
jgi:glutamate-1-semialdehyde aminotransferase